MLTAHHKPCRPNPQTPSRHQRQRQKATAQSIGCSDHLLAKLEGERGLIYAQVPFVDTEFVEMLIRKMFKERTIA
jgi:hypothetical protein